MAQHSELTGNDYVSLPAIAADGAIHGITVVHGALGGLLEWTGPADTGLLSLHVSVNGASVDLATARWTRVDRWIPTFTVRLDDGSVLTGTFCAPAGYPAARGFFIRIELDNRGRRTAELSVRLDVAWSATRLWHATPRPLPGANLLSIASNALLLETDGGRGPAWAIGGAAADAVPTLPERTHADDALHASLLQSASARSNSRAAIVFLAGVGRERDGAIASLGALRRQSPDQWLRQARLELSHSLRSAQDHRWAEPLNRNLLFNRYFAVGRGIDDDRLYVMRSRSTRCARPAVLNDREALLYTLPCLILADPGIAREAMFRVFEIASDRSGELARYIDGGTLDSGFVLDQLLLYAWAVDHFANATGDEAVFGDGLVRHIVVETDQTAFMRLHPEQMLASTDLLPSGDVADYPYATLANVLLWHFCERFARAPAEDTTEEPPRMLGAGPEVAAAIWQHCVTDIEGSAVLASSADLEGAAAVYDDPALSLALLPFFGFCSADDPVWRSTMEFLRSPRYPLWRTGTVPGLADRSAPDRGRTAALCADILAGTGDALGRLLRLQLPEGVAAASYDVGTGVCTEPHDAALAGFIAWTLVRAAEPKQQATTRKTRRR
jgi:hypothetical protein